MAAVTPPSTAYCDAKILLKANLEPLWNNSSVFPGDHWHFFGTKTCPSKLNRRLYGTTSRFQEGDAANENACAPFGPG